jgi:hypothetical protein
MSALAASIPKAKRAEIKVYLATHPTHREEVCISKLASVCTVCHELVLHGANSHFDAAGTFWCAGCCDPCPNCPGVWCIERCRMCCEFACAHCSPLVPGDDGGGGTCVECEARWKDGEAIGH